VSVAGRGRARRWTRAESVDERGLDSWVVCVGGLGVISRGGVDIICISVQCDKSSEGDTCVRH
jgi:hypothetical protein